MPCWAWVATPIDVSSPLECCSQNHEILFNKGMKYWDSTLNAIGSITFMATIHIAIVVIGWKQLGEERIRQT
jgi:hypothetical protein